MRLEAQRCVVVKDPQLLASEQGVACVSPGTNTQALQFWV